MCNCTTGGLGTTRCSLVSLDVKDNTDNALNLIENRKERSWGHMLESTTTDKHPRLGWLIVRLTRMTCSLFQLSQIKRWQIIIPDFAVDFLQMKFRVKVECCHQFEKVYLVPAFHSLKQDEVEFSGAVRYGQYHKYRSVVQAICRWQ